MKLKDFLKKKQITGDVCIGSKTGFVYVGVANEDDISEAFNDYLKKIKKSLARNERELKSLVIGSPVIREDDNEEAVIFARARSIRNKFDNVLCNRQYINKFVPALDREVKEYYNKMTDKAVVIIVSGTEKGEHWFK